MSSTDNRAMTEVGHLVRRLTRDGSPEWAARLERASADALLHELDALKESGATRSTWAMMYLLRAIELLTSLDGLRDALLDARLWCLDESTYDAFRVDVRRFFDKDRVLAGTSSP